LSKIIFTLRLLHRKCASTYKQKRLWRLSAQPHPSEFESPEHGAKLQVDDIQSKAKTFAFLLSKIWKWSDVISFFVSTEITLSAF